MGESLLALKVSSNIGEWKTSSSGFTQIKMVID